MPHFNRRTLLAATGASALSTGLFTTGLFTTGAFAQGTAAPALPPAPTPAQWAKANAISHVNLSPDGKHICYVTEVDAVKFLYAFDLATKKVQSFNMGKADVSTITWVDNTHVLVTALVAARLVAATSRAKGQRLGATVFNLEAGTQNILFLNMPEYEIFVLGQPRRIKFQGKTQLAAVSYKKEVGNDNSYLVRFDLDGTKSWVMEQADDAYSWLLTPEGEMLARECYDYKHRNYRIEYRKNGGWKEIYHYEVERYFPSIYGFAADGKSLIVSIPNGDISDICQMSPEGVVSAPLVERGSNRRPTFDQNTLLHNGYTRNDGWIHYEFTDPARAAVVAKAQKATEGYRMLVQDFGDDPNQTIIYTEGDDDAGTYYYIDFATKKPLEIGKCYPDIPTEWITSKQSIRYKAGDGLDIPAYLTLPANREPKGLPLIVYPHAGPFAFDDMGLDWVVQAFASRGYAVLQPNYRGSTHYGQDFITAGHGEWGRKMQTDLSDGVAFLVSQGIVDAKKVAIFGDDSRGYGGYAALAGVTLQSGIYNCAIAYAAISDLQLYRMTDLGNTNSPSYRYFETMVGKNADFNALSPAQNASRASAPILLVHSEQDTGIDIQQSRKMAGALKSAGKPVDFIEFKAEDNWGIVEKSRIEFITYVTDFLTKHNPA